MTTPLGSGRIRRPDFWLRDEEVFLGEGEWESKKWEGFAQARDYSELPEASGAFLITYPDDLRRITQQRRLITVDPQALLSGYRYSVAFMRPGRPTALKGNLRIEDIPAWLEGQIHERVSPEQDIAEVIHMLRQAEQAITLELGGRPVNHRLFRNLFSGNPVGRVGKRLAREAAGYLLLNQIAFYRVLSHHRGYPAINPDAVQNPAALQEYFNEVLQDNYVPVFSFGVHQELGRSSLSVIRKTIKAIYGLSPEFIGQGILGKIFHELIPLEIRKPLAAYYTLEEAAHILADLSIKEPRAKIADFACGSGTLLVSAYQRKKTLWEIHVGRFSEEAHKQFVEKEITGVDVMAFAAHLSTIHLALQGPIFSTNSVRIAIRDSTTLEPLMRIPPMEHVLPRARRQRRVDDFQDPEAGDEMVEAGAIALSRQRPTEFELEKVDLAIMNPPFTRVQLLTRFDTNYLSELQNRFTEQRYDGCIDSRMPYCAYFLLLADKFLKDGGRLAFVLPATILRGNSTEGIRRFLLRNYQIEYIIIRENKMNFSEDTDFREILLIAKKGLPTDSLTYVVLRELREDLAPRITHANLTTDREADFGDFMIRKVTLQHDGNPVGYKNLFYPVSVSDTRILRLWEHLLQSARFMPLGSLVQDIQAKDQAERGGLTFAKASFNASDARELRNDFWQIEAVTYRGITVRSTNTQNTLNIPKRSIRPLFRRIPYRKTMDVSNLEEYVLYDEFPQIRDLLSEVGTSSVNWAQWQEYLKSRSSNLSLVDRFDLTAPGTCLLSYYSYPERVWARIPAVIRGLSDDDAKLLCLWFNSTLGLVEVIVERMETRGGYMQLHKFIMKDFPVPDLRSLSRETKNGLIKLFDALRFHEFPSIIEQFAMLTDPSKLDSELLNRLRQSFGEELLAVLGRGFPTRREIDRAILKALDWSEHEIEHTLNWLYSTVLKEVLVLKEIMEGKAEVLEED